jgi:isopenicillin N synthase-like dioxygenase
VKQRGLYTYEGNRNSLIDAFQVGAFGDEPGLRRRRYFDSSIDTSDRQWFKQTNQPNRLFKNDDSLNALIKATYDECEALASVLIKSIGAQGLLPNLVDHHSEKDFTMEFKRYNMNSPSSGGVKNDSIATTNVSSRFDVGDEREDDAQLKSHCDLSTITLLLQSPTPTSAILQVWLSQERRWLDAVQVDETVLINVGDFLERWTKGALVSTKHRVIATTPIARQPRYSLAMFAQPNWHAPTDDRSDEMCGDLMPLVL